MEIYLKYRAEKGLNRNNLRQQQQQISPHAFICKTIEKVWSNNELTQKFKSIGVVVVHGSPL